MPAGTAGIYCTYPFCGRQDSLSKWEAPRLQDGDDDGDEESESEDESDYDDYEE